MTRERSTKATSRQAGFLYLLIVILAPFYLIYIPGAFFVAGDAAATAQRITAGELTLRLGIAAEVVASVVFLLLALKLYKLFEDVDRKYARLMVVFVSVSVAIELANCVNLIAPLILLSGADFLSVFTKPQLDAFAFGFVRLRNEGIDIVSVFWGLWLFPLGVLFIKSGFFPRILGVLLIAACLGDIAESLTSIIMPNYTSAISWFTQPLGGIAEVSTMLWLVVRGANVPQLKERIKGDGGLENGGITEQL